ncbi:hypothetical protein [Nonomuraea sp. NPDC049750]|uniref:hypothetical protein n=1 Tax=Nonomuraea sp. NPDC049750 TaxID=3154738 RepID=UPI00340E0E5A
MPCYEFCVAGGPAFVRRSTDGVIHETAWTMAAEAERVWGCCSEVRPGELTGQGARGRT